GVELISCDTAVGRVTTMTPTPALSSAALACASPCVGSLSMRLYAGIAPALAPIFVISCARESSAERRIASFCVITTVTTLPSPLSDCASGAFHVDTHEVLAQDASNVAPARPADFNSERMVLLLLSLKLRVRPEVSSLKHNAIAKIHKPSFTDGRTLQARRGGRDQLRRARAAYLGATAHRSELILAGRDPISTRNGTAYFGVPARHRDFVRNCHNRIHDQVQQECSQD